MSRPLAAFPVALTLAMAAASAPASAGIVFREVETVGGAAASGGARQVRQVFSDGDNCKVLVEESSDPLAAAGSYILATRDDAFLVDPATKTVAPLDPAEMEPVAEGSDEQPPVRQASGVTLERQVDEPGPAMLGLQTRHFVYRLTYQEETGFAGEAESMVTRLEERHEFWATPLPRGEQAPAAWQALRVAEDAGRGPARRELREGIDELYQHGLMLRQIIERRATGAAGPAAERVVREVTAFGLEKLAPETFQKPKGFSQTEFLSPRAGED